MQKDYYNQGLRDLHDKCQNSIFKYDRDLSGTAITYMYRELLKEHDDD